MSTSGFVRRSGVTGKPGTRVFMPQKLFKQGSFWNTKLAADAPLHASSSTWAQNLALQLGLDWTKPDSFGRLSPLSPDVLGKRWFSYNSGAVPLYIVPKNQPLVPVPNRYVLIGAGWDAVQEFHNICIQGVPIPDNAVVDASSDKTLCIWQPSTGRYWELWIAQFLTPYVFNSRTWWSGWFAWGGGYFDRSYGRIGTFQNRFAADGVTQIENYAWGHTATGLPICGGVITPEEWASSDVNAIQHPLHITVGTASSQFIAPAHRTDGGSADTVIREGARVRLPATEDLSWLADTTVYRHFQAKKLALALRDYGGFVTDTTGGGVSFRFRNPNTYTSEGVSPYPISFTAPAGFSGDAGTSYQPSDFMGTIPWFHAEVVDASVSPES